jgi:hypothetical protein
MGNNEFEDEVKHAFLNTFIWDLIYSNPKIKSDKTEFADHIIDFFDSCLIIQCKCCSTKDDDRFIKRTLVHGLNQLKTSVNRAKGNNIEVEAYNEILGKKDIDFRKFKRIYPILIVNDKFPFLDYKYLKEAYPELNKLKFTPLILSYEDLLDLLTALDTPIDLFDYLEKREEVAESGRIFYENEKELLAYYVLNNRSFYKENVAKNAFIMLNDVKNYLIEGDIAEIFKKKKDLENKSYYVDSLISTMFMAQEERYLKPLERLIKLDRFRRRMLADAIFEKISIAKTEKRDAWRMVMFDENDPVAYVIYVSPKDLEYRNQNMLAYMITAKYRTKVKEIIAISPPIIKSNKLEYNSVAYLDNDEPLKLMGEAMIQSLAKLHWGELKRSNTQEFPDEILKKK